MSETRAEKFARMYKQMQLKQAQKDAVAAAMLKLDMMGLTVENGMVECPPPEGTHPSRWKAMLKSVERNGFPN